MGAKGESGGEWRGLGKAEWERGKEEKGGRQRNLGTEGGRGRLGERGGAPAWDSASSHRPSLQVSLKYSIRDMRPSVSGCLLWVGFAKRDPLSQQ